MTIFKEDEALTELFREGLTSREVPKDSKGNYVRGGLMQMRPKTMRLMTLSLENFRAFRGEHSFVFEGRNVLVYGENGSGKTSLWSALDSFFGSSLNQNEAKSRTDFARHRYQHNRQPGHVRLEVLDETANSRTYVWSSDETPFNEAEIRSAARVRACLDYRTLWETYFLHRKKKNVNIWPLLIDTLIPHLEGFQGQTIQKDWFDLRNYFYGGIDLFMESSDVDEDENTIRRNNILHAEAQIATFNAELEWILSEVKKYALSVLSILSPGLIFDWTIKHAQRVPLGQSSRYILKQPEVILRVRLREKGLRNHHNLLNEARLSALALSIYLAAALINAKQAQSGFKILALDDVLIGLDMSNRKPILQVLNRFFTGWQIFLFTYDYIWYEIAAAELDQEKWKNSNSTRLMDQPVYAEAMSPLERSRFYLDVTQERMPDYKAAGVYARAAFEIMLKRFFKRHDNLKLPYKPDDSYMLGDMWPQIEKLEKEGPNGTRIPLVGKTLFDKIEAGKKQVYNPLCHSQSANYHKAEVVAAINLLIDLEQTLDSAQNVKIRKDFVPISSSLGVDLRTVDLSKLTSSELGQILGSVKRQLATISRESKHTE